MPATFMKTHKKRFAKYPSIFGKLGLRELCQVARDNGMVIMSGRKPDMHCFAEIGLYGTQAQMGATETQWEAAGNHARKRNEGTVFSVSLKIPREDWVDVKEAEFKRLAIPLGKSKTIISLNHGAGEAVCPEGWRPLRKNELPAPGDAGFNKSLKIWHPLSAKDLEYYGPQRMKEVAFGIIRPTANTPVQPQIAAA